MRGPPLVPKRPPGFWFFQWPWMPNLHFSWNQLLPKLPKKLTFLSGVWDKSQPSPWPMFRRAFSCSPIYRERKAESEFLYWIGSLQLKSFKTWLWSALGNVMVFWVVHCIAGYRYGVFSGFKFFQSSVKLIQCKKWLRKTCNRSFLSSLAEWAQKFK